MEGGGGEGSSVVALRVSGSKRDKAVIAEDSNLWSRVLLYESFLNLFSLLNPSFSLEGTNWLQYRPQVSSHRHNTQHTHTIVLIHTNNQTLQKIYIKKTEICRNDKNINTGEVGLWDLWRRSCMRCQSSRSGSVHLLVEPVPPPPHPPGSNNNPPSSLHGTRPPVCVGELVSCPVSRWSEVKGRQKKKKCFPVLKIYRKTLWNTQSRKTANESGDRRVKRVRARFELQSWGTLSFNFPFLLCRSREKEEGLKRESLRTRVCYSIRVKQEANLYLPQMCPRIPGVWVQPCRTISVVSMCQIKSVHSSNTFCPCIVRRRRSDPIRVPKGDIPL